MGTGGCSLMARIRTIKPELWTDPEFVECSPNARLLFVAALNFASDYGVMADKPVQLKMQCFPGDDISVVPLIDELIEHGFWVRRTAPDGSPVLVIRTFLAHQRVDKPQPGRWGSPSDWPVFVEPSPIVPRTIVEPSSTEGKGMEGMEGKGSLTIVADKSAQPKKPSRFEEFYALYPRKEARGDAERAYVIAVKAVGHDVIMAGLERTLPHLRQKHTEGYCVAPARWLKGKRWNDEPSGPVRANTAAGLKASAIDKVNEIRARNSLPELGAG